MADKYPECEKLARFDSESRIAHEFLEWLEENDMWIIKRSTSADLCATHDKIVADFLGIDMKVVEQERQAMLAAMRSPTTDCSKPKERG